MRQDLDLLQGSWTVAALEMEGQETPAGMLANARVVVKGTRFTTVGMGDAYEGALELDTSTNPRQLNMKFDTGPEKGNTNLGIYEIAGDVWKICLATRGSVRPSSFATTPGSGFALETLVRGDVKVKAPKKAKAAPAAAGSGPATEFEGEWRLVSGVMDGKQMEESVVKWVKRVTKGNQTTVYAGPQVMLQVEFTTDASKSPKAIDYINIAGANKGKTQHGIYEFDGDLLKFHIAAPGAPRPTRFEPGDSGTLTVWKR